MWWLGCVLYLHQDDKTVSIKTLIPHGPSQSYMYPAKERVITVLTEDALTIVDPRISYRRICAISKEETKTVLQQYTCKYRSKIYN